MRACGIRQNSLLGASGIVTGAGRGGELLQLQIFQMLLLPFGVLLPDITMFLDLGRFPAGQGHGPLRTGHGLLLLPHLLLGLPYGLEAFLFPGGQCPQGGPEIRDLFQRKGRSHDGGVTPLLFFLPPGTVTFQLDPPPLRFLTGLYQPPFLQPQGIAGGVFPIVADGQQGLQRIASLRHDAPLPHAEAVPRLQHDFFQSRQGLLERAFFLQPLAQKIIDRLDMPQGKIRLGIGPFLVFADLHQQLHFRVFGQYLAQGLGILGESGSGKSMTCKALLGLLDDNFQVTGSSRFEGRPLLSQTAEQLRRLRGGKISMVLQNPMSCFDPLYRIGEQMAETLQEHTALNGRALQKRMEAILRLMRIHDPADVLRKYPHQLSGGMLQRVMIGLAICMQPSLIIADEPTTAIDSISQYAIMQEFLRIKRRGEVSMIFISHDLGVLSLIADKVIVMHDGKAVESGTAQEIFDNATDTYTRHLIKQHRAVMHRFLDALHAPVPGRIPA